MPIDSDTNNQARSTLAVDPVGEATRSRRLDLQGVRALAILLVVGFHSGVPGFDSGYVGVDVFFVLSGFLIAGISSRALADGSSGGIPRLIVKRLGRLVPAAAVLMLLLGGLAFAVFGARDRFRLGGETVAASLARMNLFLQQQQTDYLSQGYDSGLLEHFWSLSLEWQFYGTALLLVIAAFVLLRFSKGGATRHVLLILVAAGTAVSLLFSITLSPAEPAASYLAYSTRLWEFGAGALVWFAIDRVGPVTGRGSWLGSGVGLLLVVIAGVSFGTERPYPGVLALIPVVGTVMLIAFTGNAVTRVLALPGLQFLGDRSYSWYLWHWPLLVLFAMYLGQPMWPVALLVCTLALGIAHVSFRTVENPSRRWAARAQVGLAAGVFGLCVVLTVAVGLLLERSGEEEIRLDTEAAAVVARETGVLPAADPIQADASIPRTYAEGCHADFRQDTPNKRVYGDPAGAKTVFLWGDSQAAQWFPALSAAAEQRGWRLVARTKSSCPPVIRGDIWLGAEKREYRECLVWNRKVLAEILDAPTGSLVLLGAYGGYHVTEGTATPLSLKESVPLLRQTAGNELKALAEDGVRTSVFEEIFASPRPVPSCIDRLGADDCSFVPQSDPVDLLRGLPATEPMIETRHLQCPAIPCPVVRDGVITMRDDLHLTAAFSASFAPTIAASIDQMLATPSLTPTASLAPTPPPVGVRPH